jgi:hypothetical protein
MAWALALPLAGSLQPAQAATSLSFLSSPYSYVGGGETVSAGPDNGFDIGVHGDPFTMLSFSIAEPWTPEGLSRYWNLELAAPEGASLSVGSYANATRWPFQETKAPGLTFSGNYRGNNRLTGSFNILESNVADDGTFSFAVDFLQYDEESTNAWIKGAIRYNSEVPVNLTPEPIVVDPRILEPWPGESIIDPPISILPYPIDDQDLPVYWYFGSSGSSFYFNSTPITINPTNSYPVPTPGPLPIAGVLAGWQSARRLRRRCRESSQSVATPGVSPQL